VDVPKGAWGVGGEGDIVFWLLCVRGGSGDGDMEWNETGGRRYMLRGLFFLSIFLGFRNRGVGKGLRD
jgi:hypothetical protein